MNMGMLVVLYQLNIDHVTPPINSSFWISNVGNTMVSSSGKAMIFGSVVPPPGTENWITDNYEEMVDDTGDFLIFGE